MSKRAHRKYDPKLKMREQAKKVASRYTIAGVSDIDSAVFVFNEDSVHVRLSKTTAVMINEIRHHWTVVSCVAGRFKNGKVWVRYTQADTSVQATAHEVSPLVTELVEEFFNEQDANTRLCKWWLATPNVGHIFTAEQVIMPAYKADVFRAFINKNEAAAGVEYGNHPPKPPKDLTIDEFKKWWDANRSPRSQLQELWIEE